MVMKFTPPSYPWKFTKFCLALTRLAAGADSLQYDVIVYDTTGAGVTPGNLVATISGLVAKPIGIFGAYAWFSTDVSTIPNLTSGSYFFGFKYNPQLTQNASKFCMIDQGPSTPLQPGYYWNNLAPTWTTAQTAWTSYRCFGMRTIGSVPTVCNVPELMYFRFANNTASTTPNTATTPVGTVLAPWTGSLGNAGMYDTCFVGAGLTGTTGVLPGWNCNLAATQWTIGFWVKNLDETVAGNPTYLFGDPGSTAFRCFYGGAALPGAILFRGPFTDITVPCVMPNSYYYHFVYDGTNILIYQNGVLLSTNPRAVNMPTGTGFRVAGYTGGAYGINNGGRLDEFRLYNRALGQAEITATWNKAELPNCLTGINDPVNETPSVYSLAQNYPNPFNPSTAIKFTMPKAGLVKLVVFDLLGREVATLLNENVTAGTHSVTFDASMYASGVYFYRIETGSFTDTKKMLLVK
jgi:hypothetical protein